MIFDTHAHYDAEQYIGERDQVLAEVFAGGVGRLVDVGTTIESSELAIWLAQRWPQVYAAVGIHPEELAGADFSWLDRIGELAANEKVVAIGEIGLDYYWNKENCGEQKEWFCRQLELARKLDLPVIIHSRDAAQDTFDIIRQAASAGNRGVMHCYSSSVEMAREYIKLGFFLGIGGVLTYDNSRVLKDVVREIPLEWLVLETDCPYLTPNPWRKKRMRNQSNYLTEVVRAISSIKEIPEETVLQKTWENANRLFGLCAADPEGRGGIG